MIRNNTIELTKEMWKRKSAHRHPLPDSKIKEIKRSFGLGMTLKQLALKYGKHFSTISRIVNGRKPRGTKRKLTFAQAEEIRRRFRDENQSIADLARAYKVSSSTISLILQGKHYKTGP
jgi:transcriptional regulator with XRE-family HTH domain